MSAMQEGDQCRSDVGWTIRPTGSEALYELHTDDDGHVTVECHCPRCEAERARDQAAANSGYIGPREILANLQEAAKRLKADDGRDSHCA